MTNMKMRGAASLAILAAALLLAALAAAQGGDLPSVDLEGFNGIPQSITLSGYPVLGSAEAPIQVIEYCSLGALDCAFYRQGAFPALLEQIVSGAVSYIYVPLTGEESSPTRNASRAALCAAEQGQFWRFSKTLYDALLQTSGDSDIAFTPDNLLAAVDALGIDRAAWDACMLTDRADQILAQAAADRNAEENFTGALLPFVKVNGVPTLPEAAGILDAISREMQPTIPSPDAAQPEVTLEPTIVVTFEPLLGEQIEPPLDIVLPPDWQFGYDTLLLDDVDVSVRAIPFAVYTGSVTGGEGTIVLLWGFPNLVAGNPFMPQDIEPDLWADGLRLLRLAIIEQGCNIGTDLRRSYVVGGKNAVGTQFAAVDCPELPDTRGWFAGVREGGINFVFYVFADPIEVLDSAEAELQAILDTVSFRVQ